MTCRATRVHRDRRSEADARADQLRTTLATPEDLAAALALAPDLTARYRLSLPTARSQVCDGCSHSDLCRERRRASLWAVCERPDTDDLLALGYRRAIERTNGAARPAAPQQEDNEMSDNGRGYGISARIAERSLARLREHEAIPERLEYREAAHEAAHEAAA